MVNSKYEYVKDFEVNDNILFYIWIVICIDGCVFIKYVFLGLNLVFIFI